MKKTTRAEILKLTYKIDVLFVEFESMNIPDEEWRDDFKMWVSLDQLAGLRNQLVHKCNQMAPDQVPAVFENAIRLYEDSAQTLSTLQESSPECFNEKESEITPQPVTAKVETSESLVVIIKSKKNFLKKISAEKIITFCGYFFPKKFREEAKGDILETRHEMIENGRSKTAIFLVTVFKIVSLILGSLCIRLSDLVKTENEMNK